MRSIVRSSERERPSVTSEAFRRETDRGLDETLPRQASVLLPGHVQTGDGAGDAYREMAQVMPLEAVLAVFEPHRVGRFGGRHLAEIEGDGLALGRAEDEKTASSDIAGRRMRHGEGESGGDRGVNGVSAVLQDVDPNLGGEVVLRDDHPFFRSDRHVLGDGVARDSESQRCDDGYFFVAMLHLVLLPWSERPDCTSVFDTVKPCSGAPPFFSLRASRASRSASARRWPS